MVYRVQALIANGWADRVVDPDNSTCSTGTAQQLTTKWEIPSHVDMLNVQDALTGTDNTLAKFCFTNGNIIDYFTARKAADGLPRGDFKSINHSALDMFRCGHVHEIKIGYEKYVYLQAKCWAEMKKGLIYKIYICMDADVYDIIGAKCGCPAGKGPNGSCKHIAAVCYAVEEFCRLGQLPEFLTSTDKQQEWHRPREGKLNVVPVHRLNERRSEILKQSRKGLSTFDPRQPEDRKLNEHAIEQFRCELMENNHSCLFLDILIPSADKIAHDHCYSLPPDQCMEEDVCTPISENDGEEMSISEDECIEMNYEQVGLKVTASERLIIESKTRSQQHSELWHQVRHKRITGSICGRVLCQKIKTKSLLLYCLYPKPLNPLPAPILWGRRHESVAIKKYLAIKNPPGTTDSTCTTVEACGFIIHPQQCYLGASPDGRVTDKACTQPHGIIEIKCPYSKREVEPEEACKDSTFFCELKNSKICLKSSHAYYHQVQLQLYVGSDLYNWCDFCVFTTKGLSITRIFPDHEWLKEKIPELEFYWKKYMKPELVNPRHKPSYYL